MLVWARPETANTEAADTTADLRVYEASLAGMGMTLDEVEASTPLSTDENADLLRDAETWVTPAQLGTGKARRDGLARPS